MRPDPGTRDLGPGLMMIMGSETWVLASVTSDLGPETWDLAPV